LHIHLNVAQSNIFCPTNIESTFCIHIDIFKRYIRNRHLFDSFHQTSSVYIVTGHARNVNITEHRSPFGKRFERSISVEQTQHNCLFLNIVHHDIVHTNIFDITTTAANRFDADASVSAIKHTVRYGHFAHTTRHFAANDHPAMTGQHSTVGHRNVFAGNTVFATLRIATRFDSDAVVAHTDMTVGYVYIFARRRVNPVGIGRIRIIDRNSVDRYIFAKLGIDCPER
jgi:hypothetical protein